MDAHSESSFILPQISFHYMSVGISAVVYTMIYGAEYSEMSLFDAFPCRFLVGIHIRLTGLGLEPLNGANQSPLPAAHACKSKIHGRNLKLFP